METPLHKSNCYWCSCQCRQVRRYHSMDVGRTCVDGMRRSWGILWHWIGYNAERDEAEDSTPWGLSWQCWCSLVICHHSTYSMLCFMLWTVNNQLNVSGLYQRVAIKSPKTRSSKYPKPSLTMLRELICKHVCGSTHNSHDLTSNTFVLNIFAELSVKWQPLPHGMF